MTERRTDHRLPRCARLRSLKSIAAWCLVSAGVEARQPTSVGRTKWIVCYKVHVVPSRRTEYRTSITLWPDCAKKAHLTKTARVASRPYQNQLVSDVWTMVTSIRLSRELAVESVGPFRRLLEDSQGLQFAGTRGTQTGALAKRPRSSGAVEPHAQRPGLAVLAPVAERETLAAKLHLW